MTILPDIFLLPPSLLSPNTQISSCYLRRPASVHSPYSFSYEAWETTWCGWSVILYLGEDLDHFVWLKVRCELICQSAVTDDTSQPCGLVTNTRLHVRRYPIKDIPSAHLLKICGKSHSQWGLLDSNERVTAKSPCIATHAQALYYRCLYNTCQSVVFLDSKCPRNEDLLFQHTCKLPIKRLY